MCFNFFKSFYPNVSTFPLRISPVRQNLSLNFFRLFVQMLQIFLVCVQYHSHSNTSISIVLGSSVINLCRITFKDFIKCYKIIPWKIFQVPQKLTIKFYVCLNFYCAPKSLSWFQEPLM